MTSTRRLALLFLITMSMATAGCTGGVFDEGPEIHLLASNYTPENVTFYVELTWTVRGVKEISEMVNVTIGPVLDQEIYRLEKLPAGEGPLVLSVSVYPSGIQETKIIEGYSNERWNEAINIRWRGEADDAPLRINQPMP